MKNEDEADDGELEDGRIGHWGGCLEGDADSG